MKNYKSSSRRYIRSENPIYRWGFLSKSFSKITMKFKLMARIGVPQSDWVSSSSWNSPIVPLGPPRKNDHKLALNIDTYVDYVDK